VATLRPTASTVAIYYVHSDALNTPREVTLHTGFPKCHSAKAVYLGLPVLSSIECLPCLIYLTATEEYLSAGKDWSMRRRLCHADEVVPMEHHMNSILTRRLASAPTGLVSDSYRSNRL